MNRGRQAPLAGPAVHAILIARRLGVLGATQKFQLPLRRFPPRRVVRPLGPPRLRPPLPRRHRVRTFVLHWSVRRILRWPPLRPEPLRRRRQLEVPLLTQDQHALRHVQGEIFPIPPRHGRYRAPPSHSTERAGLMRLIESPLKDWEFRCSLKI